MFFYRNSNYSYTIGIYKHRCLGPQPQLSSGLVRLSQAHAKLMNHRHDEKQRSPPFSGGKKNIWINQGYI